MSGDLRNSFLAFCDFAHHGSTKCTDKTLRKICTDCRLYNKIMDENRVDIQFRKYTGNCKADVDYDGFLKFIKGPFSDIYARAYNVPKKAAIEQLKAKIASGSPQLNNTTEFICEVGLERLCDVKLYTGTHKCRFDPETGKGMGIAGREDIVDCSGYVNGYTNMNTYDKVHPPKKHQC